MIEAAMIWNEPNNKSHWDPELDPDWVALRPACAGLAGEAIAAEAPGRHAGCSAASRRSIRLSSSNMQDRACSTRIDVVAVHGFPLDWNLWQIDEWPAKARRDPGRSPTCRSGSREVRRLDLRRGGGAGIRAAAHRRAADRPGAAHPLVQPVSICRRPGRRPRATARPRARPTTGISTWGCCARTARRSPRWRSSADTRPSWGICQWFHFDDHRLDDAVRWLKRLGVRICAPDCPGPTASGRTRSTGSTGRCRRWRISTSPSPSASRRSIAGLRRTTPARRRRLRSSPNSARAMIERYAPRSPAQLPLPLHLVLPL